MDLSVWVYNNSKPWKNLNYELRHWIKRVVSSKAFWDAPFISWRLFYEVVVLIFLFVCCFGVFFFSFLQCTNILPFQLFFIPIFIYLFTLSRQQCMIWHSVLFWLCHKIIRISDYKQLLFEFFVVYKDISKLSLKIFNSDTTALNFR